MHIMSMKVALACDSCASCSSTPSKHCGADLPRHTNLRIGSQNNIVYGTQLNGFSHNNPYGDDKQSDTNFPLARLTWANRHGNTCSPGVRVLRFSHDDGPAGPNVHSIAPGHFGFTHVDLPSMPEGTYSFVTVNQRHSVEHG